MLTLQPQGNGGYQPEIHIRWLLYSAERSGSDWLVSNAKRTRTTRSRGRYAEDREFVIGAFRIYMPADKEVRWVPQKHGLSSTSISVANRGNEPDS